jgi:hypothetical protein
MKYNQFTNKEFGTHNTWVNFNITLARYCVILLAACLFGSHFDHEDEGNTFLEKSVEVYQTTRCHDSYDTILCMETLLQRVSA